MGVRLGRVSPLRRRPYFGTPQNMEKTLPLKRGEWRSATAILPISVGINPTAEIGVYRHFVGIPKTDKMTNTAVGLSRPVGGLLLTFGVVLIGFFESPHGTIQI